MKQPKNYLTLTLMTSSMVLLVALQVFWLGNAYEKASGSLRGETSRLLRESVMAVRDSTLLKSIEALPPDSTRLREFVFTQHLDTTISTNRTRRHHSMDGQVQVYISSDTGPDSARLMLRSIASQLHEGKIRGNSRFAIRLSDDSLSTDSIAALFRRALTKAGKGLTFELKRRNSLPPIHEKIKKSAIRRREWIGEPHELDNSQGSFFEKEFHTDWIRIDPVSSYSAVLSNVRPLLIREIAPQILFGGFLTALTMISFVFMYRSIRSQQRLMAIKNDFISNITHELKTPIATVSVALEALKSFRGIDDPKRTAEYLDIAQMELGRLSILSEKVLTTSMFDERGVTLEREPVDVEKTVAKILNSMKLVAEKMQAKIDFQKTGEGFVVEGSTLHLTNVVYNLLDNALKYSPSAPVVTVSLADLGHEVQFVVADKGLGIPAEFHTKIFERFFRMPTGDVHNIKGYGLGLSYADQVVKLHGGSISVVSSPGEGSTFTLTLPKKQA